MIRSKETGSKPSHPSVRAGLRPGDIIIMDNLSSYKRVSEREPIEVAGVTIRFFRPYSSDFNPIDRPSPNSK
jgi:transposase